MKKAISIILLICIANNSYSQSKLIDWNSLNEKPYKVLVSNNYFFEDGSISSNGKMNVTSLATFLNTYPNAVVEISNPYFSRISEKRNEKEIHQIILELNKIDNEIKARVWVEPNKNIKYYKKSFNRKPAFFKNKILITIITFGTE